MSTGCLESMFIDFITNTVQLLPWLKFLVVRWCSNLSSSKLHIFYAYQNEKRSCIVFILWWLQVKLLWRHHRFFPSVLNVLEDICTKWHFIWFIFKCKNGLMHQLHTIMEVCIIYTLPWHIVKVVKNSGAIWFGSHTAISLTLGQSKVICFFNSVEIQPNIKYSKRISNMNKLLKWEYPMF